MAQPTGLQVYKKYWEDQANFMDKEPWAIDKILKINLICDYNEHLKEIGFSSHSTSKEGNQIIIKIKIPYNYFDIDNFELKALELLGIDQNWLIGISFDNSNCKSAR